MSNEKDAKSAEVDMSNLTDEQKKAINVAEQIKKIMEENDCDFQVNHVVQIIPKKS